MKIFLKFILPGIGLILAGFIISTPMHIFWGTLSFVCFFVMGVTLIAEGLKRRKKNKG